MGGQLEDATQIKKSIRGKTASVKEFVETKVSDIEEEQDLASIPVKIKEGESYVKHGVKAAVNEMKKVSSDIEDESAEKVKEVESYVKHGVKVAVKEMKKVSSEIEESTKSTKASGVVEKMDAEDAGVQQKIELKTSLRKL